MKIFRLILCILLLSALLLAPPYLTRMARRDFFAEHRRLTEPSFSGTVTLYHIVSDRTHTGSLTNWLSTMAEKYEKRNKGTHILVEGMTEPFFLERISYGRIPDGVSFFSGVIDAEDLKLSESTPVLLKEGLFDLDRAVPYCYSGYCSVETDLPKAPMPEEDTVAALLCKAEAGVVTDFRSAGDCVRNEEFGASYRIKSVGNYTDQVGWLGVWKTAGEEQSKALCGFYDFLREEAQQQTLCGLGAFSVLDGVEDAAPQSDWKDIYAAYRTVLTPDPFALCRNRDALGEDAHLAKEGDPEAKARFEERMAQILNK